MAINVEKIIIDSFLDLCEQKNLHKITVQDIIAASGVSRQTFYNHFIDKNDLIHKTYETRIVTDFSSPEAVGLDYYDCCLRMLEADKKYIKFMKPACEMTGQNSLVEHMIKNSLEFDHAFLNYFYGKELSPKLMMLSDYHSYGKMHMRINWILDGCKMSPEELLQLWFEARTISLNDLFFEDTNESPYTLGASKAREALEKLK